MSWQATTWAEQQKTGSPGRKLLLLLLANFADANGVCWPAQARLAEGAETSIDTVQRHLRKLEADGLIHREKRLRAGGQWPGHTYRLNMPTGPQIAARSEPETGIHSPATGPHRCGPAGPQPARSPGRTAMRYEQSKNIQSEQTAPHPHSARRVKPKAAEKRSRRDLQDLQRRVVTKLGSGDIAAGWVAFGGLTGHQRAALESLEEYGELNAARIAEVMGPRNGITRAIDGLIERFDCEANSSEAAQ